MRISSKLFKLLQVPARVGSIVVVVALTDCSKVHSMIGLKAAWMNVQCSLIALRVRTVL